MLSDRQIKILNWIVEEYVKTAEPVGSKTLSSLPDFQYSSATIRNDMAALEEQGYLLKTHTSSGRIPSALGYKYYVEHLVTRDYDVVNHFPLIDRIFNDESLNKEQMIKKAIDLGVAKINVNTECQLSFAAATRKYVEEGKDLAGKGFDPRKLLAPGADAIKATVKEKMELFGSVGKANA